MSHQIPDIKDLYTSDPSTLAQDVLLRACNQPVHRPWVEVNKFIKPKPGRGPHEYLPIDKIKWLLIRIFGSYEWKITGVYQVFNAIVVTGTLIVPLPGQPGKFWRMDGIGANGAQTDADATAADISKIKGDAMVKGAGTASTYALKNAAEHFGTTFGSALNQGDDFQEFQPVYTDFTPQPAQRPAKITAATTPPQIAL